MRVTESTIFDTAAIQAQQSALLKTQQQIATGNRMETAADDPVSFSAALSLSQDIAVQTQLSSNRITASNTSTISDGVLGSVIDAIKQAQDLAMRSPSTVSEQQALGTLAKTLLGQITTLANSADGQGVYLYSGLQGKTIPFVNSASGVQYRGDDGQRMLQVDTSAQAAVVNPGSDIFMRIKNSTGSNESVFTTVSNLAQALSSNSLVSSSTLTAISAQLGRALEHITSIRAVQGSKLNWITGLEAAGKDMILSKQKMLAHLSDTDYAAAISQLTQQTVSLEAAQLAFKKVSSLSLFDYI